MVISTVLFDLDGTIVDSSSGIRHCASAAMVEYGLVPLSDAQLRAFIGPPLRESFRGLGVPETMLDELAHAYRHHYTEGGLLDFTVYGGIRDVLSAMRDRDVRLGVATSKPTRYARRVVASADLAHYFECVLGPENDDVASSKAQVIEEVLDYMGVSDVDAVLMVGDREHDVRGARAVGTNFVGVAWGFGGVDELRDAGAQIVVDTPNGILDQLDHLQSVRIER